MKPFRCNFNSVQTKALSNPNDYGKEEHEGNMSKICWSLGTSTQYLGCTIGIALSVENPVAHPSYCHCAKSCYYGVQPSCLSLYGL